MRVCPKTKEVLDNWEYQVLKNWAYSKRSFVVVSLVDFDIKIQLLITFLVWEGCFTLFYYSIGRLLMIRAMQLSPIKQGG